MGTLQDALKKANLVDKKQGKKAAHEQRVRRKELGEERLNQEQQEKEHRQAARQAEKKARDRRLEAERREKQSREQTGTESAHRLQEIISREALRRGVAGPRRFHFVDRNNRVPFLGVSDEVGERLTRGELAIVESPARTGAGIHLVTQKTAARIQELDPDAIRFWNR